MLAPVVAPERRAALSQIVAMAAAARQDLHAPPVWTSFASFALTRRLYRQLEKNSGAEPPIIWGAFCVRSITERFFDAVRDACIAQCEELAHKPWLVNAVAEVGVPTVTFGNAATLPFSRQVLSERIFLLQQWIIQREWIDLAHNVNERALEVLAPLAVVCDFDVVHFLLCLFIRDLRERVGVRFCVLVLSGQDITPHIRNIVGEVTQELRDEDALSCVATLRQELARVVGAAVLIQRAWRWSRNDPSTVLFRKATERWLDELCSTQPVHKKPRCE